MIKFVNAKHLIKFSALETTDDLKDELQVVHGFQNVYSPYTILGFCVNALKLPVDGRLLCSIARLLFRLIIQI